MAFAIVRNAVEHIPQRRRVLVFSSRGGSRLEISMHRRSFFQSHKHLTLRRPLLSDISKIRIITLLQTRVYSSSVVVAPR